MFDCGKQRLEKRRLQSNNLSLYEPAGRTQFKGGLERGFVKLLVVHLSDIHVYSAEDPILQRATHIANAVQNLDYDECAVLLLVSGDIAFGGLPEQYDLGWQFISDVGTLLSDRLRSAGRQPLGVYTVAIPGNHDCDFSSPTPVRDVMIDKILQDHSQSNHQSVVDVCTSVQGTFFLYADLYCSVQRQATSATTPKELSFEYRITVGTHNVSVVCFNTAWVSHKSEKQGQLYFPPVAVPPARSNDDLVLVTFHHPYAWMPADPRRDFQKRVDSIGDIVFTGHEHDSTFHVQDSHLGEHNMYIEGGALQDAHAPQVSAFNALVIDLAERRQKLFQVSWTNDLYVPHRIRYDDSDSEWDELQVNRQRVRGRIEVSASWNKELDDPGLALFRHADNPVRLPDIYVYPDLEEVDILSTTRARTIRADTLPDIIAETNWVRVTGDNLSGKTSLAKMLFRDLARRSYVPLYLDGAELPAVLSQLQAFIEQSFSKQYDSSSLEHYRQLPSSRRVLIIDNFAKWVNRARKHRPILGYLMAHAHRIVSFGGESISEFSNVDQLVSPIQPLSRSSIHFRITELGYVRRDELIDRWLLLGNHVGDDVVALADRRQDLSRILDTLMKRKIVPSYPFYVLAVLLNDEMPEPLSTRISTYGAYYELFIRNAISRTRDPKEYDVVMGYLTYMAYQMFLEGDHDIDEDKYRNIHRGYVHTYVIDLDYDRMKRDLIESQMIHVSGASVRFRYSYIRYYFIANYLREHIAEEGVRSQVRALIQEVYREDNSSVLLFMSHLSRDPFILNELLAAARGFYPDVSPAYLDDDSSFLSLIHPASVRLTYVEIDPETTRRAVLQRLDEQDRADGQQGPSASSQDLVNVDKADRGAVRLAGATRVVEILGQILKNFPGSIDGDTKRQIATCCCELGLRILGTLLSACAAESASLVNGVSIRLREANPSWTDPQVDQNARQALRTVVEIITAGLVIQIADSLMASKSMTLYREVFAGSSKPAVRLVYACLAIGNSAEFPAALIKKVYDEIQARELALAVLRITVLMRFWLFPVPQRVRSDVCGVLDIPYHKLPPPDPQKRIVR
jgi:hypothetical protein